MNLVVINVASYFLNHLPLHQLSQQESDADSGSPAARAQTHENDDSHSTTLDDTIHDDHTSHDGRHFTIDALTKQLSTCTIFM